VSPKQDRTLEIAGFSKVTDLGSYLVFHNDTDLSFIHGYKFPSAARENKFFI
jgi:hypothetical protein